MANDSSQLRRGVGTRDDTADEASATEATPLLVNTSTPEPDSHEAYSGDSDDEANTLSTRQRQKPLEEGRTLTYLAMAFLGLLVVGILLFAYIIPGTVTEYAKQAAVLEPTGLSIDGITAQGLRARVQATFRLDGKRVSNDMVRNMGKAVTWVVHELANDNTSVQVRLPEHNNTLLGTATVPPLSFNLRDGMVTPIDFVTDLMPGDAEGYRVILNQWLKGELHTLRVMAQADVPVKSGWLPLGTHSISETLNFEVSNRSLPSFNITRLNIRDVRVPGQGDRMQLGVDVTVRALNSYPVSVSVPPLGFEMMISGCEASTHIPVADAHTETLTMLPSAFTDLNVRALVGELPDNLTRHCPNSELSPLDVLLNSYTRDQNATVYVKGGKQENIPSWLGDMLSSFTVAVPIPQGNMTGLQHELSLTEVDFELPNPFANPGDEDSNARVSGTVVVKATLPAGMQFDLNVTDLKATSDVFYHNKKFGELNVRQWQHSNSTLVGGSEDNGAQLSVNAHIDKVPLEITDSKTFSAVVQEVLLGNDKLVLGIKARVDVRVETVLGQLVFKEIAAEGKIPVKPIPKGSLDRINPQVGDLSVVESTSRSLTLRASVNVTNPTPYAAHAPFFNLHILCNGTLVGQVIARDLVIKRGANSGLVLETIWNPSEGGSDAEFVGREMLSQYLSGWNTTVSLKWHRDSIPSNPALGEALSRLKFDVRIPRISLPGDTEDGNDTVPSDGHGSGGPHFIREATFHFFSSTASCILASPLLRTPIFINSLNATAFYNGSEPVGRIIYDLPFAVVPGSATESPRLPVDWSLGSIGYDAIRQALGHRLKLDAFATVRIGIGLWRETLWYRVHGIGAHVQP